MWYTSEELKDLILLSQGECRSRHCSGCRWHSDSGEGCPLLAFPTSVINVEQVTVAAKEIIREIIANEIHNK